MEKEKYNRRSEIMAKSTKSIEESWPDENLTASEGSNETPAPTPPPTVNQQEEQEAADASRVPVIYCGPSIPRANIISMSLYRGGLPKNILALIEKYPEIGHLIVPVTSLAETQQKVSTQGTEENRLYQAIAAQRKEIENGV
jgi:hypothetical protein